MILNFTESKNVLINNGLKVLRLFEKLVTNYTTSTYEFTKLTGTIVLIIAKQIKCLIFDKRMPGKLSK